MFCFFFFFWWLGETKRKTRSQKQTHVWVYFPCGEDTRKMEMTPIPPPDPNSPPVLGMVNSLRVMVFVWFSMVEEVKKQPTQPQCQNPSRREVFFISAAKANPGPIRLFSGPKQVVGIGRYGLLQGRGHDRTPVFVLPRASSIEMGSCCCCCCFFFFCVCFCSLRIAFSSRSNQRITVNSTPPPPCLFYVFIFFKEMGGGGVWQTPEFPANLRGTQREAQKGNRAGSLV